MVLLIRGGWCWVLDTANRPSEWLLPRDDVYGDIRVRACGDASVTLRLDASGKLPNAGAAGASKPNHELSSAVFGPSKDGSVGPERYMYNQLNP